jgi:hypothetical protein
MSDAHVISPSIIECCRWSSASSGEHGSVKLSFDLVFCSVFHFPIPRAKVEYGNGSRWGLTIDLSVHGKLCYGRKLYNLYHQVIGSAS